MLLTPMTIFPLAALADGPLRTLQALHIAQNTRLPAISALKCSFIFMSIINPLCKFQITRSAAFMTHFPTLPIASAADRSIGRPVFLTQRAFVDLAHRVTTNVVNEIVGARALVPGKRLAAEAVEFLG